jgi:hypothetical protein
LRKSLPGNWKNLEYKALQDQGLLLDLVDFVAYFGNLTDSQASLLEQYLAEAGSEYRVGQTDGKGKWHLEKRVMPSVQTRADAIALHDRPGRHLGKAWSKLYQRSPEPSIAYLEAVRGVEAAAIPVVLPNDDKATLGRVIGHLKAASTARQDITLIAMLGDLWHSQWDRHGIPDDAAPMECSLKEAERAVHLALTLVQFFRADLVRQPSNVPANAPARASATTT